MNQEHRPDCKSSCSARIYWFGTSILGVIQTLLRFLICAGTGTWTQVAYAEGQYVNHYTNGACYVITAMELAFWTLSQIVQNKAIPQNSREKKLFQWKELELKESVWSKEFKCQMYTAIVSLSVCCWLYIQGNTTNHGAVLYFFIHYITEHACLRCLVCLFVESLKKGFH